MEPLWLGPYTIHQDLGKGLYELQNKEGKLVKKKLTTIASKSIQGEGNQKLTEQSEKNLNKKVCLKAHHTKEEGNTHT